MAVTWRRLGALLAAAAASAGGLAQTARADPPAPCPATGDVLVLGAMPLEVAPLLEAAVIDPEATVRVEGRDFYRGTLSGTPVVIAMTRIGMVNATQTAKLAFETFTCGFDAVVFSGVAGSTASIGDVTVADSWSVDGGETRMGVDAEMLAVARDGARVGGDWEDHLTSEVPIGDEACLCPGVDTLATPASVGDPRKIVVGGTGVTGDTYGGKALPCGPGAGDVFGCQPCLAPGSAPEDAAGFATSVPTYLDPGFFAAFFTPPDETTTDHVAQDQETGAVLAVARDNDTPFLGIRGVSDGAEDPLHLPGFPFQFFAYRHLAADNAAAVTVDFLADWVAAGRPTDA